jgi:hypothetical protein
MTASTTLSVTTTGCGFVEEPVTAEGFLVTLSNEEVDHRDPIKIVNEIGLDRVAGCNGAAPEVASIPMRDNSLNAYRRAAKVAEDYALPYLLGIKSDYEQIFGK